jgi:hypothetical protein
MAGETDYSAINGAAKRVYDKSGLKNSLPGESLLQKRIPYGKGERVGEAYQIGVVLRPPNGFTYSGSSGDARTLKSARNMVIKQAQVVPFELELREQFTLAALSRAAETSDAAFAQVSGEGMKAMKFSASNRLEMNMLNGQRSLGTVSTVTDNGDSTANIVITDATWRPGLWWALGEKATLDSFTSTTKNNASGPIILEGITASSKTIKISWTGTLGSEIAAGDVLYFEGAWDGTTYTEAPGLIAQASNLTGTSLGLSASTYMNWKGNTYDVAGNITFDALETMCGQLRDRKAAGKISAYFSNKALGVLVSELKALRVIDSSYSAAKGKVGHKGVAFETPDIGEVEILGHGFMAESECLLLNEDDCERVGSSDLTFGIPGTSEDAPVFERVQGTNYAECILFTDQATALKTPSKALVGTGITFT